MVTDSAGGSRVCMSETRKIPNKFNRRYVLKLETADKRVVTIGGDLTIEFNIVRNTLASANTASFSVKNLAPKTRSAVYKDLYNVEEFRAIQFFAGYDDLQKNAKLTLLFNGTIKSAYNNRPAGGTEFSTDIECFDGTLSAFDNINLNIKKGVELKEIFKEVTKSMTDIDGFTIGDGFNQKTYRGSTFMGNPKDYLRNLSGGKMFVDSRGVYILQENEVLQGSIKKIDNSNGILGTPRRQELFVEIDMLFEPRLKPAQLIELESVSAPEHNGTYKVVGFRHSGIISGSEGGTAITTATLQFVPEAKIVRDNNSEAKI